MANLNLSPSFTSLMAKAKEIKVGSIVQDTLRRWRSSLGIVMAYPSQSHSGAPEPRQHTADIYWFKEKYVEWEYISYLKVVV